MIDALESRRMLSVVVNEHVLVIQGTRRADDISVRAHGDTRVDVAVNGVTKNVATASFGRIRINGGNGSDNIYVDVAVRVLVMGGDGNDYIQGGEGRDTLLGEAGDDRISGLDGNDSIRGGDGNDSASGGPGDDKVLGDAGDDKVEGNLGDDFVWGGRGDDVVWEGPGTDRCFGNRGRDHFMCTVSKRDVRDEDVDEVVEYVASLPSSGSSFTYDDGVSFNDLVVLSQNYNQVLASSPSSGSFDSDLAAAFKSAG
jgi:Ca2+-binding RTX toxin-like protein